MEDVGSAVTSDIISIVMDWKEEKGRDGREGRTRSGKGARRAQGGERSLSDSRYPRWIFEQAQRSAMH